MNKNLFRSMLVNNQVRERNIETTRASDVSVSGRIPINGMGEAYATINFPVKFTQLPVQTFGFERPEGQGVVSGQMPTGNAYVHEWLTIERLPISVFYSGANIHIVTTGPFYGRMMLTYTFSGPALTNPSL